MSRWSGGSSSSIEPWLGGRGGIVDLYCGIGTFALFFAKHGWNVIGVEENAQAIAEAVANARLNGLERARRFVAGRVEQALGDASGYASR